MDVDFCSFVKVGGGEDNVAGNQQVKGILRKNSDTGVPVLTISKPNKVTPRNFQELAEVVANCAIDHPIRKPTPNKTEDKENKNVEKKSDNEQKAKKRETVVAFGRTTLAEDTIPAAKTNLTAPKKSLPYGLGKDVVELRKEVEEQNATITQLQNEIETLKDQNSKIHDNYSLLLDLVQKLSDKITKIESIRSLDSGQKTSDTIKPFDSIALKKNDRRRMNVTIAEDDPNNHPRQERRDVDKALQPYSTKNSGDHEVDDLIKKNPGFARELKRLIQEYNHGDRRREYQEDDKPLSTITERHERRREYRGDGYDRRKVRESYTLRREVCYSPNIMSTTIDDTLKEQNNFTHHKIHEKENNHHHRPQHHHRRQHTYREPTTPRVEEVSEDEWNEDDHEKSKIYDRRDNNAEFERHHVTRVNTDKGEAGNIQYTVMKDRFEDDFDDESHDERQVTPKNHRHHRVADRFARQRKM